jgi:hypothetical protein
LLDCLKNEGEKHLGFGLIGPFLSLRFIPRFRSYPWTIPPISDWEHTECRQVYISSQRHGWKRAKLS